MKETKRVIVLKNIDSPFISQAIFFLREGAQDEFCALKEAERIVSEYMHKKEKREKRKSIFLLSAALLSVFAVFLCLYFKF